MGAFEYNFNLKKSNIISYKNRAYIERVFNLKKKKQSTSFLFIFYGYSSKRSVVSVKASLSTIYVPKRRVIWAIGQTWHCLVIQHFRGRRLKHLKGFFYKWFL